MKGIKIGKLTIKTILLIVTVIVAVAMLVSAWGGLIDPNKSRLLPLATLAMPIVLIVNLLMALVWLLMLKWKYALIPIAAIAVSWSPVSTVCPLNMLAKN